MVTEIYPDLKIKEKDKRQFLKGIIDISNIDNETIKNFLIEIHWKPLFPFRFPKLFETGGDIPCKADWHKYSDNSCCLTVEPEEILLCKDGISVLSFIQRQVIPYLANQCYRVIEGNYKNEYPHGYEGVRVFYTELMKTSNVSKWFEYLDYAFYKKSFNNERNKPCFCGSGLKYKRCHDMIFNQLRIIGKERLTNDFLHLISTSR